LDEESWLGRELYASNEIQNTELECCVQLPPLLRREASSVREMAAHSEPLLDNDIKVCSLLFELFCD
jgi:hypothetical protein